MKNTIHVVFTHHGKHVGILESVTGSSYSDCLERARGYAESTAKRLLCDSKSDGAVNVCKAGNEQGPLIWSSRILPAYDDSYKPWRD
ncbi:hypothetical protein [Maridesulfovibrio salexigens]|uniref:hypothetical protein n=1 Tax=Maridesulfovibrio salexigens TaxID=880 RepID=UPI0005A2B938|nr:hypothetical protein [Maridesulfovibrio salexigens]